MMKYVFAGAAALMLGACTTTGADGADGVDGASVAVAGADQQKGVMNGRAMADTKIETNEDGEEIICKREKATGSRVRVNEICGTKAQWDQKREANRKGLNDLTGNRAASNSQ